MDSRGRETLRAPWRFRRGRDDGRSARRGGFARQNYELFKRRDGGGGVEAEASSRRFFVVPSKVGTIDKRDPSDELTRRSGRLRQRHGGRRSDSRRVRCGTNRVVALSIWVDDQRVARRSEVVEVGDSSMKSTVTIAGFGTIEQRRFRRVRASKSRLGRAVRRVAASREASVMGCSRRLLLDDSDRIKGILQRKTPGLERVSAFFCFTP